MAAKIAWVIDENDNVATILSREVKKGSIVPVTLKGETLEIQVRSDIPYGHKIAIRPIPKGSAVYKYGLSIGRATADISVGEHVHVHNIESTRGRGDLHGLQKEVAAHA